MSKCKIAHISDLHFGPSHDSDAAGFLVEDLKSNVKPDLVIVSGDLTDWGRFGQLEAAHSFLINLCHECNITLDKMIVIPGNHDVNNIQGRLVSSRKLRSYSNTKFNLFSLNAEKLHKYYEEYEIAVFCFDSTLTAANIAEGEVCRPKLLEFTQRYNEIITNDNRHCYKIAVVHHHPLPIPHTSSDNFLLLRKAGDFLKGLMEKEVDIVLYGHKHEPFFSNVRYRVDGKEIELACVGAGSSTQKMKEAILPNSFNVLSFDGASVNLEVRESRQGAFALGQKWNLFTPPELEKAVFDVVADRLGYVVAKRIGKISLDKNDEETITISLRGLKLTREWKFPFELTQKWSINAGVIEDVEFNDLTEGEHAGLLSSETEIGEGKLQCSVKVKTTDVPPANMEVDYDIVIHQKGGFARTHEEFLDRQNAEELPGIGQAPHETFAQIISEPAKDFELVVEFFPGYKFDPDFAVLAAGKPQPEMQRLLRSFFSFDRDMHRARLQLRYPRLGYAYGIYWDTMKEEDLDRVLRML